MSDFIESEAEESDNEEVSEGSDGEGTVSKRPAKQKKKRRVMDSDDDEEDGEELDKDLDDLIDDNPEEPEEESEGEENKRKHDESDLEEDLSDEDFDLIEENLGIKVNRKHKRKRIKIISDDEDSDRDEQEPADEREQLQKELFDDMEEEEDEVRHEEEKQPEDQFGDLEGSEESDVDDFIVDEEGQPISKVKKKKHIIHDDAALQEAQDIFGVDFDFDEFDQYGEEYEEEEEEIDEYEEPDMEDGEAPPTARRKKTIKRRTAKSSIFDVFEPSELERGHFTDVDQEIRMADMPERFQLRRIPVCPTEEGELEEEAEWIFKMAFNTPPVSTQDWENPEGSFGGMGKRSPNTTQKIRDALNFMRNQQFEVPFIAFYRKEYVEPELNINDLWKIYQWDEKWMQLRNRKTNMVRLFEKMQNFQFDQIDPEKPLESHVRALTEEDLDAVKNVQTMEELGDVYQHFLLYYGSDIPKMKNSMKKKNKKERVEGEEGENEVDVEEDDQQETLKQATRKSGYTMCQQAGLADMARKFGLTPEQFGENLRDNYQRHEPEQDPAEPAELAGEYVSNQFRTVEDVLQGSRHMVAMQIAHDPMVRQAVRQTFNERAKIHAKPTKKGLKEIDEAHPCYTFKYLKNKPIKSIAQDQFLKLTQAEEDGLMTFSITIDSVDTESQRGIQTYFEEIKSLYHKDEFSHLVQEWNTQRSAALERALNMILYPQMIKELKNKLIEEAKEHIIKACTQKLYNWLKVAPYQVDQQLEDEDDDYDSSKGLRVMAIAYVDDWQQAAFAILVDGEGEVTDFLRLGHLLKRKNHFRADIREHKLNDLEKLKDFIAAKKPHVIGVGAESREALNVCDDVRQVVSELEQEQQMAPISVELVDNELSIIYMNSKKSESDFREYPPLLRQAVSMARRLQEPLVEFCQLCNPDEDILALKYHPLQNSVNKEDLLDALHLEFINRVNEVGVDINKCVAHPYTAPLVQFICGLGPRKGFHLLKILKQNNSRLENRTQLVTMCHMGPKVFINCAGFIKIDTNSLGESTEAYVEVLDGSRVHPETYEWARKMAVDALEYDDTADDANPAGALEEILEAPERLKDLDLDAFAEELERQGYGNKHITLYDIRAELNHRYKDLRTPYSSSTPEEKFNMLTKESPATFYIGKLIQCQVTGIATKKPRGEQLDQANPVRNDETNLWQCPFCRKNDFPELSEVWNHFDAGECHGQSVGVKTRLDNSVMGFLPCKMLSDKKVENPEDRVKIGMTLHCRIVKIDIAKFQVDLTSRTSDLMDKEGQWKLPKDLYYDQEDEDSEIKHEEEKKKQQARQTYVKRVIAHPSFHNIDYKACEKLMASMEQGEVVIRPSSKGSDHLTCTWKVADGILHHIDIREEGKENAFSLGQSLWINNEEYEDLDEIIARFVQPMSAFGRDMLNYKYYVDSEGGKREILDKMVIDEKKKAPSKIPYFFSASKQYPAKFLLSYLPRKTVKHEYVTVTPDGFRYRGHTFHSINHLVRWFKEHFRDPIPGTPQSMRTPAGGMTGNINQTPSLNLQNVDAATIQRAAAGLSSSVFNTLSQVAGQTPAGQFPAFNAAGWQQPITTPMMTPMMTATPGQAMIGTPGQPIPTGPMGTPQYQPTPRTSWNQLGNQPGGSTPSGMTPRQGGMTPRQGQGQGSGMTPRSSGNMTPRQGSGTPRSTNMTPRHSSGMTPRQDTHSAKSTPRSTPKGGAATDWAKAAEMWRKQMEKRQGNRTPGQSPMVGGSTPGGGGGTPLFDER